MGSAHQRLRLADSDEYGLSPPGCSEQAELENDKLGRPDGRNHADDQRRKQHVHATDGLGDGQAATVGGFLHQDTDRA